MVPPCSSRITRVPLYSSLLTNVSVSHTGLSPAMAGFSRPFCYGNTRYSNRALPRSLATTSGISVDFFSSGYLDVSVPRVCFMHLCIQCTMTTEVAGFPHSEIHGSKPVCRLPVAYRRLLRLSSPVAAKASTICAYSLDHITPSSLSFCKKPE